MIPALTVVVAVKDADANLAEISARLSATATDAAQIIFVFAGVGPEHRAAPAGAEIITAPPESLVPHLWREGILHARGAAVALTSAHCIPSVGWLAALMNADLKNNVGVGGVIDLHPRCSPMHKAIYFLRYLRFAPPQQGRVVSDVAADNAVYRLADVRSHPDLLREGFWEPSFHRRFHRAGMKLSLDPGIKVTYRGRETGSDFAKQRYQHGCEFGAARSRTRPFLQRLIFVLASPLPPLLIFARVVTAALRRPQFALSLPTALPWLLWFVTAWSLGEARGYLDSLNSNQKGAQRQQMNEAATADPPSAQGAPAAAPTISVIMPAYNAEAFLPLSLPPLAAMLREGKISELIVVDDTSTDRSRDIAAELGARVIPSGGRLGPGGARNIAAAQALGDILWFVDSDVVARESGPGRVADALTDPGVWAVFGSYDDRPAAQNFGSQYKNLVHHHVHQLAQREASTFWAGCGAVRRDRFLAAGGFDASRYKQPSIEDIELGYRLRDRGGRITLDKEFLAKHLKRWSVPELIRVDIFRRALPWARLMLQRGGVDNDLNVSWTERLRAGLAGLIVLSGAASLFSVAPPWTAPLLLGCAVLVNWQLFLTFARHRGLLFALLAITFHQVYYLYSIASFLWCWLEYKLARRGG